MALSQLYSAIAGDIITAARWNNEFGNIYSNGTDVAFPVTKAVSFGGFTLTLDAAGVSTLTSPANSGFLFTVGAKSGAPSASGSLGSFTASTFTDTDTASSGTAALWSGLSVRTPTLVAAAALVTTAKAASVYIEGSPTAGANETITEGFALLAGGDVGIEASDARTNTVDAVLKVQSTTSDTPAAGIGVGILFNAESADEAPSQFGQLEFAASDVGSGTEDTYFQVLTRAAGAALSAAYRFTKTAAFNALFTQSNTADRTYKLPDNNCALGTGVLYKGPTEMGSGSTRTNEGDVVISGSQALTGIHFYDNLTIDAGVTVTPGASSRRLIIIATKSITINGTIDAGGIAAAGGATAAFHGNAGTGSTDQPAGAGGAGTGLAGAAGAVVIDGISFGTTQRTGSNVPLLYNPLGSYGGAGGGSGSGNNAGGSGGSGGTGGGSVILIAPLITFGAASVIDTSGNNGANGGAANCGGGGGGGGGNLFMFTHLLVDSGATYTLSGGSGGSPGSGGSAGSAGAAGIKQVYLYT